MGEDRELKRLLKALADPLRLQILATLGRSGRSDVSSLAKKCGVSIVKASKSLTLLRALDLVESESLGNRRIYEATERIGQGRAAGESIDLRIRGAHSVLVQIRLACRNLVQP